MHNRVIVTAALTLTRSDGMLASHTMLEIMLFIE